MSGGGVCVCVWGGGMLSAAARLVAAAGIQPRALLGACKPLHSGKMNGNTDVH